jgi:hypothetical protein
MLVISIILEAAVAIIAILAARKGKPYIYGLAFTFGAYVLYDLARVLQWDVQGGVLSGLFLLPNYFSNAYARRDFPVSERGNGGETP